MGGWMNKFRNNNCKNSGYKICKLKMRVIKKKIN